MQCPYCGANIPDSSTFCTECGKALSNEPNAPAAACDDAQKEKKNSNAVAGFICSLGGLIWWVAAAVGLVLSIVGAKQIKNSENKAGQGLATAGITIGAVLVFLKIVRTLLVIILIRHAGAWISFYFGDLAGVLSELERALSTLPGNFAESLAELLRSLISLF